MSEKHQYPQIKAEQPDAAAVADGAAAAAPQAAAPQGFAQLSPQQAPPYAAPPIYIVHQPAPPPARSPLVSIISPEDAKSVRKVQLVHFAATMLQLACCVAIIMITRYHLAVYTATRGPSGSVLLSYNCWMATAAWPGTCEYAFSLASISIFCGFILSLMQCLTMDCCGMGRAVEAVFNTLLLLWWVAGTVTLGIRASAANAEDLPQRAARNAVVALAALCAFTCLLLLVANLALIKRLGKAYKSAVQQQQQQPVAQPYTVPQPYMQHHAPAVPASPAAAPVMYYQAQPGIQAPTHAPTGGMLAQPTPVMHHQAAIVPHQAPAAAGGAAAAAAAVVPQAGTPPVVVHHPAVVVQAAAPQQQQQQRSGISPVHLLLAHRMGRRAARRC